MDTCAVEVGLLKKRPCAQSAVAHCANCEMAICAKHAVPQLSASKQRTGKFMCAECDRSNRTVDTSPTPVAKPIGAKPAAAAPAAAPKPAAAPQPAAKPAAAPAAKAPAPQPAAKEEKFKLEDTGPIEFTPTKK